MSARIALLHHALRDGSAHVDLLIEREGERCPDDVAGVPTWRCAARPDHARDGSRLPLERIGEHRGLYLHLERPRELSDGRGHVTPLRTGLAERRERALAVHWTDGGESVWSIREDDAEPLLTVLANRAGDETGMGDSRTIDARAASQSESSPDPGNASMRASHS